MNRLRFHGLDYAAVADFGLLRAAVDVAEARDDVTSHVGLLFSIDSFYAPRPELMEPMVAHGVLAVEMEACALYTLAASYGRRALAVCTVSDHIVTGEETTSEEREQTFAAMVDIALGAASADAAGLDACPSWRRTQCRRTRSPARGRRGRWRARASGRPR